MSKARASIVAALAVTAALAAGTAQARDNVYWSIGIHAPLDPYGATIGTTFSNARPAYGPVYLQPAPVYYAPPPVYYYEPAPRVVYRPAPVYVAPQPVWVPAYYDGWRGNKHHRKHWKKHHRDNDD
jgi:hypothetical protein